MLVERDAAVGEIFRRLSMMRVEMPAASFDRAVRAMLRTLGEMALEEAESRARAMAEREGRMPGDIVPFARRRSPPPLDVDYEDEP